MTSQKSARSQIYEREEKENMKMPTNISRYVWFYNENKMAERRKGEKEIAERQTTNLRDEGDR